MVFCWAGLGDVDAEPDDDEFDDETDRCPDCSCDLDTDEHAVDCAYGDDDELDEI